MRKESVEYGELIDEISERGASAGKDVRRVLVGDRGSGKSVMLLQALTMAMMKNWVVINIPDGMVLDDNVVLLIYIRALLTQNSNGTYHGKHRIRSRSWFLANALCTTRLHRTLLVVHSPSESHPLDHPSL